MDVLAVAMVLFAVWRLAVARGARADLIARYGSIEAARERRDQLRREISGDIE